jgi:hypothetical protein
MGASNKAAANIKAEMVDFMVLPPFETRDDAMSGRCPMCGFSPIAVAAHRTDPAETRLSMGSTGLS